MDAFIQRPGSLPQKAQSCVTHSIDRPSKRVKVEDSESDSPYEEDSRSSDHHGAQYLPRASSAGPEADRPSGASPGSAANPGSPGPGLDPEETPFESSLPPVKTDKDAIEEYESMRAAQDSEQGVEDASRVNSRKWVTGRSSIYVDAFNLALETVLTDEGNLFDQQEKDVFEAWNGLHYEAQYITTSTFLPTDPPIIRTRYVRLFLRKTAAWHRSDRLGYYADVSDPDAAIKALQQSRELPKSDSKPDGSSSEALADIPLQEWSLGESFTFADSSEEFIDSVEEALSLLGLEELKMLAKEAKVQGRNKAELQRALARVSSQQVSLVSLGLRRSSTAASAESVNSVVEQKGSETPECRNGQGPRRGGHLLDKVMAITGPCVRLSSPAFKLFERVHLVFYRSTEWTEKSLTTIILAKISRRNFPEYVVCRSTNIFPSRQSVIEFEQAMRTEYEVDRTLENGPPGETGFRRVLELFEGISGRWRQLLREEQRKEETMYEYGEGGYLRRFSAAHALTRIAHKAAYVFGRLHEYKEEHTLLTELLEQRLFHVARRGSWYQRKALLEEHYMADANPDPAAGELDSEQQKKHWRRLAASTCERGLEDPDCHLIYHYDLQKRLVKLERKLKIPRRLQHDFGHVRLHAPEEHTVYGIQLKKDESRVGKLGRGPSTKTVWVDEHEGGAECSVEEMCLSHYRSEGWKGYHSEGGILRTLFAYLFYDVLFLYIPNVFQTAYQACPLDLHTDAFYPTRASEINHRLVEIANGGAASILRAVDEAHRERRTCVVGLNWDFTLEDLLELVESFRGEALAAVCKVMAQEYRQRGGGIPDLILWRTEPEGEVMFAEVKSANDRLSDNQRLWIHALTASGVRVALTAAVAREVRMAD